MIIINRDDFGASKEINLATYRTFKYGLISSASTLVDFRDGLDAEVGYVKSSKIHEMSWGVHLKILEEASVTERARNKNTLCKDSFLKLVDYSKVLSGF